MWPKPGRYSILVLVGGFIWDHHQALLDAEMLGIKQLLDAEMLGTKTVLSEIFMFFPPVKSGS